LESSENGFEWEPYNVDLEGNTDGTTVQEVTLEKPLRGRFVKLNVRTFEGEVAALRVALIGCSERFNIPDKLKLGQVNDVNFNMILPRIYNGHVFYYLDQDDNGALGSQEADKISAVELLKFLPPDSGASFGPNSNVLRVSGYELRIPEAEELIAVLSGSEDDRGSTWPQTSQGYISSSSAQGEANTEITLVRNSVEPPSAAPGNSMAQKFLAVLELVRMPNQVHFVKFPGKCASGKINRLQASPDYWADGSREFSLNGRLGSIAMCQEFCAQRAPECKGFEFDHTTLTCTWFQGEFNRGDLTEGYTCYISEMFSCKRSFSDNERGPARETCGIGFAPRLGNTWCTDVCDRDACCLPQGVCTQEVCGATMALKDTVPPFCEGTSCSQEECCVPRGVCSEQDCPHPAFTFREGNLAEYCRGATCIPEDCCRPRRSCRDPDCPSPFALKSTEPMYCLSDNECTMVECCEEVATCNSVICPPRTLEKAKETLCSSMKCETSECCDTLGNCLEQYKTCPVGFTNKDDFEIPVACEEAQCGPEECCHSAGQCTPQYCTTGKVYKDKSGRPAFCTEMICTVDECCEDAGLCSNMECPVGWRLLKEVEGRPTYCKAGQCTAEECCMPRGRCLGNICRDGYQWKETRNMPEYCKETQCTSDECCTRLGECTADICTAGYRVSAGAARWCEGAQCTEKECCVKLAKCSDEPGICPFGQGYLPKKKPAASCVSNYCEREECCDLAATCHVDIACPEGQKLSYDMYCKSAEECTVAECCYSPALAEKLAMEDDGKEDKGTEGASLSQSDGRLPKLRSEPVDTLQSDDFDAALRGFTERVARISIFVSSCLVLLATLESL